MAKLPQNGSLKKNGANPNDFKSVYTFENIPVYYAFNIETPDDMVGNFQNALDALKREGKYNEIISTYLK